MKIERTLFLKPGRDNAQERENFVKFWANYMKTVDDLTWSKQQNVLINSQILNIREFYKNLLKTKEGREVLERLRKERIKVRKE
ncbi:hypothetical protein HYW75_04275 [Candidatus Pacearchaeota archaeon]|nr:hypothetical protein [Candidatus Pacearchaeota archaeon]